MALQSYKSGLTLWYFLSVLSVPIYVIFLPMKCLKPIDMLHKKSFWKTQSKTVRKHDFSKDA